ncbi:MAG TPA: CARDB domain-containing protein, partial [Thermoplasmata archaeon]|nr:CARDB domain-containing protein [Thermoplasmata archaeon]
TQIMNLTAGSSQTITYNWTFSSIRSGKHVVTVKIDDPNGLVEFSDGNNEYSITIYVGEQGNPAGGILTVGLMIVIVLFVLTYLQKPAKRGKKA